MDSNSNHSSTLTALISPFDSASFACAESCQRVHLRCRGCGVLEGPEHFHRLRDGYCYQIVSMDAETGDEVRVPITASCWSRWRDELSARLVWGAA